jgi:hypothetical protein
LSYKKIGKCRICKSTDIEKTLSLGNQFLTGVFPSNVQHDLTEGPIEIGLCAHCGLLQLMHSYKLEDLYGENYGYRSGLNSSMVDHLTLKIKKLQKRVRLVENDLVLDIGSNDATSLKAYDGELVKVGIDPTGLKFKEFYHDDIILIPDFFSKDCFFKTIKNKKAKIITAIACFYDLEDPNKFVSDIRDCLDDDGIWHFEQSYMPSMLRTNAYDTLCHEHLEFYSFKVIKDLVEQHELEVIDVEMNSVNGGSFAVTVAKKGSNFKKNDALIDWTLMMEKKMSIDTVKPHLEFAQRVEDHRVNFTSLIHALVSSGKKVLGYGASTKGNVILQYCNFGPETIQAIAEVNEDKFGSYTPGTNIPIISEVEAHSLDPDYFIVFPWHFKENILKKEKNFLERGGKFIFPLPEIEII